MSGGLHVSCSLSPVIPAPDPQPMPPELLAFFRLSLGFTHHHHMPPSVALVQRRGYLPANRKTCLRSKEWGGSPEQLINLLARCRHSPLTPWAPLQPYPHSLPAGCKLISWLAERNDRKIGAERRGGNRDKRTVYLNASELKWLNESFNVIMVHSLLVYNFNQQGRAAQLGIRYSAHNWKKKEHRMRFCTT